MKGLKRQGGMSLVEATIILMVMMLLTGVVAPSIFDFVNDARRVKVKEDCEALGITLTRLVRDIGGCVLFDGRQPPTGPGCTMANRVSMLASDGATVVAADLLGDGAVAYSPPNSGTAAAGSYRWDTAAFDTMEHQFRDEYARLPRSGDPGDVRIAQWRCLRLPEALVHLWVARRVSAVASLVGSVGQAVLDQHAVSCGGERRSAWQRGRAAERWMVAIGVLPFSLGEHVL